MSVEFHGEHKTQIYFYALLIFHDLDFYVFQNISFCILF